MKLSEMRQVLSARGIQLTKSLGQSFLHDGNQLRRIVAAAGLHKEDQVLEIGPGLGPLTELLVKEAGHVLAIDKDKRLMEFLRQRFPPAQYPSLQLVHGDALEYVTRERRDWSDWKLVSNLPYSVASPILVELARGPGGPQRLVATVQLEVARRLMAAAGDADYGVLTLLVQLRYEPRDWFKIPGSCFFPVPDVDSACVWLERRPEPAGSQPQGEAFMRVVKLAFSQRRKMMHKLLRQEWPAERLEEAYARLNIPREVRAENVGREQFLALAQFLSEPEK